MIKKYLDDLEERIDPELEDELYNDWMVFVNRQFKGDIFTPRRKRKAPPAFEWPEVNVNKSFESLENMLLHQLRKCSDVLSGDVGIILNIRANYGSGMMATLFGCELYMMEDHQDTLPTSIPLSGGADSIRKLLEKGVPDLNTGLGSRIFEAGEYFRECLKEYPKLNKYIYIYHPDMQGPLDICELIWGSQLFLDLIDYPELVSEFMNLITETYISFMRRWLEISPFREKYSPHWGCLFKGHIMLRDDSAMNLSPEMYREFGLPYDRRLIETFGGGGIHFCGRGDHYIDQVVDIPGMSDIAMSQPEYNDMEKIFKYTVDRGITLSRFKRKTAEEALRRGRDLHGCVLCW